MSTSILSKEIVDSIRLTRRPHRMSAPTFDWTPDNSRNSNMDIDIDALDAEFERVSMDFKGHLAELRKHPQHLSIRHTLTATNETLPQMRPWLSPFNAANLQAPLKPTQDEEREKDNIEQLLNVPKAYTTVDLCFLMDCTGSMRKYLDVTRAQIRQLTEAIVQLVSNKPHLAFVGYRDIGDKMEKFDFTDDEDAFQTCLDQIHAVGGDDTCEDVFGKSRQRQTRHSSFLAGGLEAVGQLSWSNANRILVHICDAPCHGRDYHDFQGTSDDNYLQGDPKNRDLSKLLSSITQQGVTYCQIPLSCTTKKMFDRFASMFGLISEIQVDDPACLIKRITEKTSAIIRSNIQSTLSACHHICQQSKPYTLAGDEPDWTRIEMHDVQITEIVPPSDIEDLFLPLCVVQTEGRMKIASQPFAKGSLRFAFYGQFSSDDSPLVDVVFKELASVASSNTSNLSVYREHLEIQAIAQFLADQFNDEQHRLFRSFTPVVYADAGLVQQRLNASKIYQVERRMHHEWRKWNNNSGGVSLSEYSTLLQAFSHWTYHVTSGRLMVVDLQGVKVERAYLLTDPALHCDDLQRFRETRTNLGVQGMRQFFRTHVCSDVCARLNLPVVESATNTALLDRTDSLVCNASTELVDGSCLETMQDKDFETIEKEQLEIVENFELC